MKKKNTEIFLKKYKHTCMCGVHAHSALIGVIYETESTYIKIYIEGDRPNI